MPVLGIDGCAFFFLKSLTRTSRKRFTAESQRAQSLRGFLRELSVSAVQKFLSLCEKQAFNFQGTKTFTLDIFFITSGVRSPTLLSEGLGMRGIIRYATLSQAFCYFICVNSP